MWQAYFSDGLVQPPKLVGIDHLDQSTVDRWIHSDDLHFFSLQLFRWFLPFIATLTTMDSLRDHITLELTEDVWHLKGWISWELTTQKSADFWFQLWSPFSVWHAQGVWRWNWNNGSLSSPQKIPSRNLLFPKKGDHFKGKFIFQPLIVSRYLLVFRGKCLQRVFGLRQRSHRDWAALCGSFFVAGNDDHFPTKKWPNNEFKRNKNIKNLRQS